MNRKMLIVDDSEMNRAMLKAIFEDTFQIVEAESGEEALEKIEISQGEFDIVLLDLIMNGISGFDVLEKRTHMENFCKIPVVVITSSEPAEDQVRAFELGANEYIIKPFEAKIIISRVNNVIELNQRMLDVRMEMEALRFKAEIDAMTGLYNKSTTEIYMNNILQKSNGHLNAMLIVDIDHFKSINDTYGHQTGDHVIKTVATLIMSFFRKSDLIGRIGGDEFCALMVDIPDEQIARKKANHILQVVKYHSNNPISERITLSIGIAYNHQTAISYKELFCKADDALYRAKHAGRSQYREFGIEFEETENVFDMAEPDLAFEKGTNVSTGMDYRQKETILLVEDQTINRKIIQKILQDTYQILEAKDGCEAIKILEKEDDISVILLDLVMPKMNGYEVLKKLPEMKKENIPVIVLTGEADQNAEEKALDLGAIDFITKPIIPKILISRLRNAVIRNQAVMLERLRKKSELDDLTGLYNRSTLFMNVKKMLLQNPDQIFAFVRFDIDQFRLYNSAMGETEGNMLLQYIASALPRMAADFPVSAYGRVDADIFCMCVPYDRKILIQHSKIAQAEMRDYREDYTLSVSFGVYVIENKYESVESMFTKSSMAADKCKNQFDKKIAFFEKAMESKAKEELSITNRMSSALINHQFVVYLQPKYDLNAEKPCGAEALVRWFDPKEGMISPGKFIGVFERNGFIAKLDYYMWEEICKLLHKWKTNGKTLYPVSVNISRVSMYNVHIPEILKGLIDKYDIESKFLQLEITESAYMSNPDLMKDIISNLHSYGFQILMDDFGSGYSSLNTLADIDVDILKIDMKFMPHTMKEQKRAKILSAVVRMAGWLGMPVIAEGVETKEQRDYLESIGCGYIQGFYYARPMPVEQYEELVEKEQNDAKTDSILRDDSLDVVWSPGPEIENLLRGIALPVGIYEYADGEVEIIRANSTYQETFNLWKKKEFSQKLGEDVYQNIMAAMRQAAKSEEQVECQFEYLNQSGKLCIYLLKLLRMGGIPKADIICGMFCDITNQVIYETQLQKIEKYVGSRNKKKLLVIDDIEVSRAIIRSMFQDKFEILEAENGADGLEIMRKHAEDLAIVLLDMVMPKMDGEGFLKEKNSREDTIGIPVIVISAEEATDIQIKMLKLGVNDYITKPFEPKLVKERIQNVISYNSRFQKLVSEYRNK